MIYKIGMVLAIIGLSMAALGGVTVTAISGFLSQQACVTASEVWAKAMKTDPYSAGGRAVCVYQGNSSNSYFKP